ncbi:hypothetical protein PG987_001219 [Apiospora arundinis]
MMSLDHGWGDGKKGGTLSFTACSQPVSNDFLGIDSQADSTDLISPWNRPPYCLDTNVDCHSIGAAVNLLELSASSASSIPELATQAPKRKRSEVRELVGDSNVELTTQKKPRRKAKTLAESPQNGSRLACPYQAYDRSQICFNPSAQNPLGGCAGIGRLRQHLRRRHMPSVRCKRCWRSFDTMQQRTDHETMQPLCDARKCFPAESMMSESQEGGFESLRMTGPEESSWWRMFQFLIPGMDGLDIASLKLNYWPYYVKSDLMMSTMTFPGLEFPAPQAPGPSPPSHAMPATPVSNTSSSDSARPATDAILLKKHDRLKARYASTQRENAELREAAQKFRSDLHEIDTALEEVLDESDLSEHVYEKINTISSMVASLNTAVR